MSHKTYEIENGDITQTTLKYFVWGAVLYQDYEVDTTKTTRDEVILSRADLVVLRDAINEILGEEK